MDRWVGRVALVTGASTGIGLSIALKLARSGMKVVGCARRIERLQEEERKSEKDSEFKGSLWGIKCDLSKTDEILAMFNAVKERYGGVDVCVNNAAQIVKGDSLVDGDHENWKRMLEVNVLAYSIVARETVRSLRSRGVDDGHLVYINSDSGYYTWNEPNWHFYEVTKHGVTAQAEGMRRELKLLKSHIRVSSISPGWVKTDVFRNAGGEEWHDEIFQEGGDEPLQPEDIAGAVQYAIAAPPHVQVFHMMILGTEEAVDI